MNILNNFCFYYCILIKFEDNIRLKLFNIPNKIKYFSFKITLDIRFFRFTRAHGAWINSKTSLQCVQ